MTFRVGQKVVCIDDRDSGLGGNWNGRAPSKGVVYTVIAVGLTHSWDPDCLPCILVAEIDRNVDSPLWAHRFRPVVERKTDISIFTKMLTGKRVDA